MNPYLSHFGLNKAPFSAHVVGNNVFVAPQLAAIVAALKKALTAEDAAVCLSGPVGAGKTTIAKRALEGIGKKRGIVTIGRMPFGPDEVLEILLAGLGARQLPRSTVHRFAMFRRLLQQFAEQETRVFVLVEDATRIGADTLSEIEALTAADAGVSSGANLILLGDDSVNELLRDPKLARLKQRLRSRQKIDAQNVGELQAYLKHCFRLAGREFDTLFADGSARTLHALSDGLPRVVNNLLESVLTIAADKGEQRITPKMIEQVAAEEFGLTVEYSVAELTAAIEKAAVKEATRPPDPVPPSRPVSRPEEIPVSVAAPAIRPAEDDIPELIQDTLPDLEILAPELATAPEPAAKTSSTPRPAPLKVEPVLIRPPLAETVHEATENELPVLTSMPAEARDEDGQVPTDIPAWDRDPTFAELRPDLEALERAMAVAHGPEAVSAASKARHPKASNDAEEIAEVIPEITLDKQIEAKIQEATEALKKTQSDATAEIQGDDKAADDEKAAVVTLVANPEPKAAPKPVPNVVPKPVANPAPKPVARPAQAPVAAVNKPAVQPVPAASKPAGPAARPAERPSQELQKIASGLARAKTIEDVDDYMAETLFGEEFSQLAAQVAANASMHPEPEAAVAELSLEADEAKSPPTMDSSPSQRLKVLRELNKSSAPRGAPATPDAAENIVMSAGAFDAPPDDEPITVDSIEDQISTTITQTLKTLSIRPTARSDADDADQDADDDDDDDDDDKGFFSRFRRK